jgi:glycosyltransferase involved in cell wall biosynthesis
MADPALGMSRVYFGRMAEIEGDSPDKFAFAIEYEIGHVTFADNLRAVVDEDPSVMADWHLLRSIPPEGWQRRWLGPRNYTFQMGARVRAALEPKRRELDAVLIHTQTAALWCWGLMGRLPIVISTDATPKNIDELSSAYRHRQGSLPEEELKRRAVSSLFRRAAAVVPWCEWTARSLRDDYHVPDERIHLIRPGLHLDSWPVAANRRPGPCRLLFVGGDFHRKGGDAVLECLGDVSGEWELDVVTKSKISAPEHVRVHNDLEPGSPRILDLYQQADVFVFPSLGDAVPWVVLEAMATQTAVIGTDVGGMAEMIPDDTGIVVAPGNPRQLREAVSALVNNADLRTEMGRAGRRRVEKELDGRRQSQRIVDRMRAVKRASRQPG